MKQLLRTIPFLVLITSFLVYLQIENTIDAKGKSDNKPPFYYSENKWIDSVFNSLSLDEKIGQMFMMSTTSLTPENSKKYIKKLIETNKIGGLLFMQGGPVSQAKLTNYYQSISKTPLFIATDGEWGLAMRLDSIQTFPRQMLMGAIYDESLIYEMGADVGRQCKRLGVHINFAPVVDVNINPKNPVINSRSFGENPANVASKGIAYMLGMQDNGIIATAKHFPGHGDTEMDSHKGLPVISHSLERIKRVELFPFMQLIDNGLAAIMVGHLHVPALDNNPNSISSLSKPIITDLLKNEMKFEGLIITDAIGMKGVAELNEPGESDLKAILAGNDIVLMSKDITKAIDLIKNAINEKKITEAEINKRCKKILKAKYWAGLSKYKPVEINNLITDLNSEQSKLINRKLVENSLTLVENKNQILPIKDLDKQKIAAIQIGDGNPEGAFLNYLKLYDNLDIFAIDRKAPETDFETLRKKLSNYDLVIVGLTNTHYYPNTYGTRKESINFINTLAKEKKVIFSLFANAYALEKFQLENLQSILIGYNDDDLTQELAAQLIYGGISAKGKLPVSIGNYYPAGYGIITNEKIRFKYSIPLELEIDIEKLKKIDTLAENAIKNGVFPGCEVLFAKNGVVFFHKSYGFHTYSKEKAVKNDDIYDLASVTKVISTLPAIMKLYDQKKVFLNGKLGNYIPELVGTNKANLLIKDILTHSARLKTWVPLYSRTKDSTGGIFLSPELYSHEKTEKFPKQVAENLYITDKYKQELFDKIYKTELLSKKKYRYSDLGFYLLQKLVETSTSENLDDFVTENFYEKLGATTLGYNPLTKFSKEKIIPTENDTLLRKQLVQGYVHDFGAAVLGGVAGHAGLFSNANDLAKVMQMYLQFGKYGGYQYIDSTTIITYNTMPYKQQHNRRALGFDKPPLNSALKSANSWLPIESFGHTGFTGTMVWADPTTEIVYVFLSNRIYPSVDNELINQLGVRRNIQRIVYESLNTSKH